MDGIRKLEPHHGAGAFSAMEAPHLNQQQPFLWNCSETKKRYRVSSVNFRDGEGNNNDRDSDSGGRGGDGTGRGSCGDSPTLKKKAEEEAKRVVNAAVAAATTDKDRVALLRNDNRALRNRTKKKIKGNASSPDKKEINTGVEKSASGKQDKPKRVNPKEVSSSTADNVEFPCPSTYNQTYTSYVAGNVMSYSHSIYVCQSSPYEEYCNIYDPDEKNYTDIEIKYWTSAWLKLGPCVKVEQKKAGSGEDGAESTTTEERGNSTTTDQSTVPSLTVGLPKRESEDVVVIDNDASGTTTQPTVITNDPLPSCPPPYDWEKKDYVVGDLIEIKSHVSKLVCIIVVSLFNDDQELTLLAPL